MGLFVFKIWVGDYSFNSRVFFKSHQEMKSSSFKQAQTVSIESFVTVVCQICASVLLSLNRSKLGPFVLSSMRTLYHASMLLDSICEAFVESGH